MTTQSEAMDLFEEHRASLLASAREIADEFIVKLGSTDVKEVFEEMGSRGLIDPSTPRHWLGAIFRSKKYKPVPGKYAEGVLSPTTNRDYGLPVKVWTFA